MIMFMTMATPCCNGRADAPEKLDSAAAALPSIYIDEAC